MSADKILLDYVYENEATHSTKIWLTQPLGNGQAKTYTWAEAMSEARRMANHLKSLGYEPGSNIGILSKNCAHFMISELAIWMAGHCTVAIFPTVNQQTAAYIIEHSELKLLFVGKLDLPDWTEIQQGVPATLPCVAYGLAPTNTYEKWDDIVAKAAPIEGNPARKSSERAIIIYTSGSTGKPKGVAHGFGPMAISAQGMVRELKIGPQDRCLSYLPLAHVFERAYIQCTSLIARSHVYFAESLDTFVADLQRARPTIFISVPRLWLKFQLGVFKNMPKEKLEFLLKVPILSGVVKKKILTKLGLNHVRLAGSGSAPIPAELIAWYRKLGLMLLEGYAMSEDFAYSHLSTETHNEPGYVGVPYPEVQVKISDAGEILIKSPGKMQGYYREEAMSAECFTDDGYFKTGDRGERKPDGLLKITGRVKEIFKTSKGKYVAPAPIENIINNDEHVELSIVTGSGQPQPYAQVVLAEDLRGKINEGNLKDEVHSALESLLSRVNAKIEHHEQLQFITVVSQEWTTANGFLTPTMKIRRSAIEQACEPKVEGWYNTKQKVIWAE
ncbi:MAG: AMP-binding protein [Myxococcota bacterium]|nr:AMP-binding protein [Myxococcota bacterium]